jgi:hypothetical protein
VAAGFLKAFKSPVSVSTMTKKGARENRASISESMTFPFDVTATFIVRLLSACQKGYDKKNVLNNTTCQNI